ncbi:MAG: SGNH/GDSL hydrolase family protein [Hyphomicrobiales bacterium]
MNFWIQSFVACVSMMLFTFSAAASDSSALKRLECGIVDPQPSFTLPVKKQKITILMIGSSSTSGVGAGDISKAYPIRTAFHLNGKRSDPKVDVIAKGVGGERAKAALKRISPAIKVTSPDLIVWQVGTNDALGKVPLEELTATIRKGIAIAQEHKRPLILIDPQFFPRILSNQNYADTVDLIARIGKAQGLPVVKRYQRMKRALGFDQNLMTSLMAKDRFHMSPLGHECLALDLAATIRAGISAEVKN